MLGNELKEYKRQYIENCRLQRRLSEKTIKAYQIDLCQFFGFVSDGEINHHKLIDYVRYINEIYSKPKTIKRKLASVKAFYAYLEYEEIIEVTPFHKIRTQIKEPQLLPKVISSDCIADIFETIYSDIKAAKSDYKKNIFVRNAAVIELLFTTGVRISELCNLKKEDVNFQDKTIRIFGKGSKERVLYLGNKDVIKVLQSYKVMNEANMDICGCFFVNRSGKRLSEQSVRIMLKQLENRLKLPVHITPHMFRHTYATQLLERDVDIRYIQKILGHSSISITQIYTYVSYPKQREIMTLKNPRNDIHVCIDH